jgi:hypothetical protein
MQRMRKATYLMFKDAGEASDVVYNLIVTCVQVNAKVLSCYDLWIRVRTEHLEVLDQQWSGRAWNSQE